MTVAPPRCGRARYQSAYLECCQAFEGRHRFDCATAGEDARRSPGPYGPVRTATSGELVDQLRARAR